MSPHHLRGRTRMVLGTGDSFWPSSSVVMPCSKAVASAMIDRIVHHADGLARRRHSYRLRDTKLALPSEREENKAHSANTNVAHTPVAENGLHFSDRCQPVILVDPHTKAIAPVCQIRP